MNGFPADFRLSTEGGSAEAMSWPPVVGAERAAQSRSLCYDLVVTQPWP